MPHMCRQRSVYVATSPPLKQDLSSALRVANSSLTGQERENLSARPAFLLSVEEYTATRFPLTLFLV
jgi:hypothetical protein